MISYEEKSAKVQPNVFNPPFVFRMREKPQFHNKNPIFFVGFMRRFCCFSKDSMYCKRNEETKRTSNIWKCLSDVNKYGFSSLLKNEKRFIKIDWNIFYNCNFHFIDINYYIMRKLFYTYFTFLLIDAGIYSYFFALIFFIMKTFLYSKRRMNTGNDIDALTFQLFTLTINWYVLKLDLSCQWKNKNLRQ